jgi:cytochrome b subunit of formate dehydrogenase
MTFSFIALILTGLPQRYARADWAEALIAAMGGIESVRIIHRIAAVIFMTVMVYHFIMVAYKLFVLRLRPTMLPGLNDARDLFDSLRYYLGLRSERPKLPRYNFAEKIEYWAVIWGGVLMAVTGFMLWNPIATASLLPGQVVPAARAAHSAEALLAFLAIIIWHVYWVHIKTFNRAMFTGQLTREQMAEEHGAELAEIEAGQSPPPPTPTTLRQRQRVFTPVASVATVVMLIGLYSFVTFEQTAITTIPPAEQAEAFVPATPTPTPIRPPTATPAMEPVGSSEVQELIPDLAHPVEEFEDCFRCHAVTGPVPFPPNHESFALETCLVCHVTKGGDLRVAPGFIKHSIIERERCSQCHEVDLLPANHQGVDFSNRDCVLCHLVE